MSELLLKQDFIDGRLDTQTLKEAVNEDKIITPRYGEEYASIPMASRMVVENGLLGATPFSTKALLDASVLIDGDYAIVTNDTNRSKNGFYQKEGTAWTQLSWNPQLAVDTAINGAVSFAVTPINTVDSAANIYVKSSDAVDFYVHNTSQILNKIGNKVAVIEVKAGESYIFAANVANNFINISFARSATIADKQPVVLAQIFEQVTGVKKVVVPAGFTHMLFNTFLVPSAMDITNTLVVNRKKGIITEYGKADIVDATARAQAAEAIGIDDFDVSDAPPNLAVTDINGYFVINGGVNKGKTNAVVGAALRKFPIITGQTYSVYSDDFTGNIFTLGVADNDIVASGSQKTVIDLTSTNNSKVKTFVAPVGMTWGFVGTKFPSLNFDITESIWINKGITSSKFDGETTSEIKGIRLRDKYAQQRIDDLEKKQPSVLRGKRWVAVGDSMTAVNTTSNIKYHDIIASQVQALTVYNYGIGGTGYYDRSAVADTITQTDFDYLTVLWGVNDWGNQKETNKKPLGTFLDTGTTTISGCVNTALTGLLTKFYDKKIAVITPLPRLTNWGENGANNAYGYTLKQLVDLIKKYCDHYSLPCLDLYHKSNLPVWIPAANTKYFTAPAASTPDGLHPNDLGHEVIANKVKTFLESI
ncbi:SGNH/GDSL hydrolase family protein [Psychrobacter immobilis]|uniref:SGNH/GDSL hydrolase family protein n=1 Tax=Psychrobacter immobilis TaxID=498 RepID=UPI00191ADDC0|nr:SGNH/GDSL hydrolase family protein [Psychrobacter immobilis]